MGRSDFMRSSFHSVNLPVTIGNIMATGLNPELTTAPEEASGIGTDVDAGAAPPILFAGSISVLVWVTIAILVDWDQTSKSVEQNPTQPRLFVFFFFRSNRFQKFDRISVIIFILQRSVFSKKAASRSSSRGGLCKSLPSEPRPGICPSKKPLKEG